MIEREHDAGPSAVLSRPGLPALLLSVLVLSVLPATALARPAARADRARLGSTTLVRIHDRVLSSHARAVRPRANGFGDSYRTPTGEYVRVYTSTAYSPDPAVNQSWANFFSSLVHGSELSRLTVYLAPSPEVTKLCGGDADSCYSPDEDRMILLGEQAGSTTPLEEIAAHEYGHHIANHRTNAPWNAGDRGPKYWASGEGVCPGTAAHAFFPGDEGAHYDLNPGEAWAETNRLLNGGTGPWNIVDRVFFPDKDALALAREDIVHPWTGRTTRTFHGAFSAHGRRRRIALGTFADGDMRLDLRTTGGLDADLELYDHQTHRRLGRSARDGGSETIRRQICGEASVDAVVLRYRRAGHWTLTVKQP